MSPSPAQTHYRKPWLSYADQVALLQSRGLKVVDVCAAAEFLSHINYYRFSGYCLAFEGPRHTFSPDTTFEIVRDSYEFDRALRDLVTEALELIELDFRTAIAHHFGRRFGAFGHTLSAGFFKTFKHADWIEILREEARRSRELFVGHFRAQYAEFPDLPIWMATEVMSFGSLSRMFSGMLREDQRAVASRYHVQPFHLGSWLHHLVYVRNLCAHHSRLWDRVWSIKPELPPGRVWTPPLVSGNGRLYATLLMLLDLLRRCPAAPPFAHEWRARLQAHLQNPPQAPQSLQKMGFTADWSAHPFWG